MSFIARARKKLNKSSPKKKTTSLDFDDDELFNNNLHKVRLNSVCLIFTITNNHITIIFDIIMHTYKVSVRSENEIGKCSFID